MSRARTAGAPPVAAVGRLLRAWRSSLPDNDWQSAGGAAALRAAARSQLAFGAVRRAGQTLLRVLPTDNDGFGARAAHIELVTDDMPFLVDTLGMTLAAAGHTPNWLVHPMLTAQRDARGHLRGFARATRGGLPAAARGSTHESWQLVRIGQLAGESERVALEQRLRAALADVRAACEDWPRMRQEAATLRARYARAGTALAAGPTAEGCALLDFMLDGHYTFLGYRRSAGRATGPLHNVPSSGLGVLREPRGRSPGLARGPHIAERDAPRPRGRERVMVSKANCRATVHRPGYLDCVTFRLHDPRGHPCGEARFVGLWTSSAYHTAARHLPLVRDKVQRVLEAFAFPPASHDGKRLASILDNLPRDELFQASVPELQRCATRVLAQQQRSGGLCLVLRRDALGRYWSCLVYAARARLDNEAFRRIEALLRAALGGGPLESSVAIGDAPLAQLHFTVRGQPEVPARVAEAALERALAATLVSWRERLRSALLARHDEATVLAFEARYADAWPAAYQQETDGAQAVQDLADLDSPEARAAGQLRLAATPGDARRLQLRLLRQGEPLPIWQLLPILENFGLRVIAERPYRLQPAQPAPAWIQDLELEHGGAQAPDLALLGRELGTAFPAILAGQLDSDGFQRLVLVAGLSLAQLGVLRACCRYLLQTGLPFGQATLERTLCAHPHIAHSLWELFDRRLNPAHANRLARRAEATLTRRLLQAIGGLSSPDDDRILRGCLAVIQATLRTNYYCAPRVGALLALKLQPRDIPGLPEPRPAFEVFLHGPRVEGVHMRRGPIARGGIRWSERPEDFRTEVLGLMKAQHVKNTLIVPVGAKGGFIARHLRADAPPSERAVEVRACYQAYIRGLLDVTDNIVGKQVLPPAGVRRRDGDDPYLVVAADKGTASFSDLANAISAEYGYWLGDAFASGGSVGYDHKAMGITARGAWECVKRHFRELGRDPMREPLTVAGIGDMSGDVFGNGLLQSRQLRLVAAFDHRHIFIDPLPNAARSWRERERLYRLPGSSWNDYDRRLLSAGGAVFARDQKTLAVSPQARALLGLTAERVAPVELVRAILKAPVDLLWNGGIGTYVKASDERHGEIGDRANDAVRIDGRELRARVVGEGGNLGCSQRGRIEFAQRGGRINTDFVDNSAGVNTSDIEVNLKIMLADSGLRHAPVGKARRTLLASVTDHVAEQVLRNNYLQSQALSLLERRAGVELGEHQRLLRSLERAGELDRAIEYLPADGELEERLQHGAGLARPELAVLLAYGKIALYHELMQADIASDPYLAGELQRYFPAAWRKRFARGIARHRLRAQLITTATTNSILHRMDPGFVQRLGVQTGAAIGAVARAYTVARDSAGLRELWSAIEALDLKVSCDAQYEGLLASRDYLEQLTRRLLLGSPARDPGAISTAVARLQPGFAGLRQRLPGLLTGIAREHYELLHTTHSASRLPPAIASWLAALPALRATPDLVALATSERRPLAMVAELYFRVAALLGIDWLADAVRRLPTATAWQVVARERIFTACLDAQRELCRRALRERVAAAGALERWPGRLGPAGAQWQATLRELRAAQNPELAALMAGAESLRLLSQETAAPARSHHPRLR